MQNTLASLGKCFIVLSLKSAVPLLEMHILNLNIERKALNPAVVQTGTYSEYSDHEHESEIKDYGYYQNHVGQQQLSSRDMPLYRLWKGCMHGTPAAYCYCHIWCFSGKIISREKWS